MKGIVQWNPVYEPGTARSIGYRFIYRATGAPLGGLQELATAGIDNQNLTICESIRHVCQRLQAAHKIARNW